MCLLWSKNVLHKVKHFLIGNNLHQPNKRLQIKSRIISEIGLSRWLSGKESTCQSRRHGFDPWVRKIPWKRTWQPTPIFLPGESHGQRSLVGYSPWGSKELDMTELVLRVGHVLTHKQNIMVKKTSFGIMYLALTHSHPLIISNKS